jgi:hypothetical protein
MKRIAIAAFIVSACSGPAGAACKYKAADGSWTYSYNCAPMSNKEIDESAALVLKKNQESKQVDTGVQGRRLRGYEYSNTTHSGMRIRMVEPNKAPSTDTSANQ